MPVPSRTSERVPLGSRDVCTSSHRPAELPCSGAVYLSAVWRSHLLSLLVSVLVETGGLACYELHGVPVSPIVSKAVLVLNQNRTGVTQVQIPRRL